KIGVISRDADVVVYVSGSLIRSLHLLTLLTSSAKNLHLRQREIILTLKSYKSTSRIITKLCLLLH
ncbi:hypothetical protein L9F63_001784, partial [Diploptera punctata]